ncbi:hypothetical protein DPMN_015501 [Dreissena polymorpha]|uniref:J domain-containing protein n=1 Tax=Dreissena polymorpha TaxID=45954 RepID=A0A9D4NBN6_DREPO|nr:hypothetical protein DPMN_015501 [Dreissena polymorpha]
MLAGKQGFVGCRTFKLVSPASSPQLSNGEQQRYACVLPHASISAWHDEGHNVSKSHTPGNCGNEILKKIMHTQSRQIRHFSITTVRSTVKVDPKKNYYLTLGVTPSCGPSKVKQAYYRLSKVYHPDLNQTPEAAKKFHELTEAYEILANTRLRQQYDDSRKGHEHGGLHRGTARHHHFSNFSTKGPPQKMKPEHHNYEQWFKEHYGYTQNRNSELRHRKAFTAYTKEEYTREHGVPFDDDIQATKKHNNWNSETSSNYQPTEPVKKNIYFSKNDFVLVVIGLSILVGFSQYLRFK